MNGIITLLIISLVGIAIYHAHNWGYDKGFRDGYEDGDYEGYRCGIEDSNRQFQRMCDEAIKKKEL